MGSEGKTPAPIFWHIGIKKKWYKLSKLGEGGGVKVIWTKSKRTATFFRETVPNMKCFQLWPEWTIVAFLDHFKRL